MDFNHNICGDDLKVALSMTSGFTPLDDLCLLGVGVGTVLSSTCYLIKKVSRPRAHICETMSLVTSGDLYHDVSCERHLPVLTSLMGLQAINHVFD